MGATTAAGTFTPADRRDLERLEGQVRRGQQDMGLALREIRDRGRWRLGRFRTFKAYCDGALGLSHARAFALIRAVDVRHNLGRPQMPQEHADVLSGLPPEAQHKVYARACAGGDGTTTARLREAKEAYQAGRLEPGPPPLPPSPDAVAMQRAEERISALRQYAEKRGLGPRAGPLLDRLLALFRRHARARIA